MKVFLIFQISKTLEITKLVQSPVGKSPFQADVEERKLVFVFPLGHFSQMQRSMNENVPFFILPLLSPYRQAESLLDCSLIQFCIDNRLTE